MRKEVNPSGVVTGETFVVSEDIILAAGNVNLVGWNKNAPVKCKILDFWIQLNAVGPAASSTLQLRVGHGEGTETFTAVSNALAVGTTADTTIIRAGTMSDAADGVELLESLNILAVASSGSHTATVNVLCQVL